MRTVTLPGDETVPALGLGTWHMGEHGGRKADEARALQAGLDLGLTLIDTAEMYGEGGAEEVVGNAIAGRRDEVFLVSKVYPHNASRQGALEACARSLRRLRVETLDLYLLHWRGSVPLSETVEAFEQLVAEGKIRHWGVSNLDPSDMAELRGVPSGPACAANQVLYNLDTRGIEWDLLPECQQHGVAVMAYTPLGQGDLLGNPALGQVAAKHGVSTAAAALAWVLRHDGMITIPKTSNLAHLEENAAAAHLVLDEEDLATLDAAFPPPTGRTRLGIL